MGIYSKKEPCCICKINEGNKEIIEGYVCKDCIRIATPFLKRKNMLSYKDNCIKDFLQAIEKRKENNNKLELFTKDESITVDANMSIEVDNKNQMWYLSNGVMENIVFSFKDIISAEIIEEENVIAETKRKGGSGIGRAVIGGAILGPAGAVVGATTKKKKSKTIETEILNSMSIQILLSNDIFPTIVIPVQKPLVQVKKNSIYYNQMKNTADIIFNKLKNMQESSFRKKDKEPNFSMADELLKFKNLLDNGAITQEEFNDLKRKLLDQ